MTDRKRVIAGEPHQVVILKITGRYPDGRPKDAIFIHDDMSTDLEGGEVFITVWTPRVNLKKKS